MSYIGYKVIIKQILSESIPALLFIVNAANGIWPPPYEIHLLHESNFSLSSDTLFSNDEAEMIQPQDISDFGLHIDDTKNIHKNEISLDDYLFTENEENDR